MLKEYSRRIDRPNSITKNKNLFKLYLRSRSKTYTHKKVGRVQKGIDITHNKMINTTIDAITGSEQEYGLIIKKDGVYFKASNCRIDDVKDKFVENGARVYTDLQHIEYASPEARGHLQLLLYEKAGEKVLAGEIAGKNGFRLVKDNGDFSGNSYGAHESYILNRKSSLDLNEVKTAIIPFLISRIIFTGNGLPKNGGAYVISQRAGAITSDSSDALHGGPKGIFHTRDEPLASKKMYRRLHIGSGDANMSEVAIYLKHGTMRLVLKLFEDKKLERIVIDNCVDTFHRISTDLSLKNRYRLYLGRKTAAIGLNAIEIQRIYQQAAEREYKGNDSLTDQTLERWKHTLNMLERDPMELADCIDWVIKKKLIDSYRKKYGEKMTDKIAKMMHVQYHEIAEDTSLFYQLQYAGYTERLLKDEDILKASKQPPLNTRARLRGRVASDLAIPQKEIGWDFINTLLCIPKRRIATCLECGINKACYYSKRGVQRIALDQPYNTYEDLYPESLASRTSHH